MTDVTKEKENKGRAKIHTPVLELYEYVTNVKSKYHKMMIYFCLCLFEKKKRKYNFRRYIFIQKTRSVSLHS